MDNKSHQLAEIKQIIQDKQVTFQKELLEILFSKDTLLTEFPDLIDKLL